MAGPARAGLVSTACTEMPGQRPLLSALGSLHAASPAAVVLSPLNAWVCGSRRSLQGTPRSPVYCFLACCKG